MTAVAAYLRAFQQRNSLLLLLLGFSSGLPLALTAGTLQAWMTVNNFDLKTIGFFSLVGQAYVLKFLWSPLMDRYTPPFLGRRRGWLAVCQLLLLISIALMGYLQQQSNLHLQYLALVAVLVAFFSASQDIVFDAYKTDLLPSEERGMGSAISVLGYRIAMLVSGGIALWLADRHLGWSATYYLMAGLMLVGLLATLLAKEPNRHVHTPTTLQQAVVAPLTDFFQRNNAWLMLLLIIAYKFGDAFAGSLSTTFLIRGVGFHASEVGLVNKSFGLVATIIGTLIGGLLMRRWSLYRALMIFGLLQAVSNVSFWLLAITAKNILTMTAAVFIENFCGGMGTAAFVALLMTLCNPAFSATQFALLSALSAIGRVYIGPLAGWFVEHYGWAIFYFCSIILALPGLLLLKLSFPSLYAIQQTGHFSRRNQFHQQYQWAKILLFSAIGGLLLLLLLAITNSLQVTHILLTYYFYLSLLVLIAGCVVGCCCDCLAINKKDTINN